jgi:hypothetical protein
MADKGVRTKRISSKILSQEELEFRLLAILGKHATTRGLTNSEFVNKCGVEITRSLAAFLNVKGNKVGVEHLKSVIYELWRRGLLFVEPPNRGQKVGRIWDMASARNTFPLACPIAEGQGRRTSTHAISPDALKAAYDTFVPEHPAGFVPIFKVRRELAWPHKDFDALLVDLNQRNDPVIELHAADPADLSTEEKRDSLWLQGKLLVRMRWREP